MDKDVFHQYAEQLDAEIRKLKEIRKALAFVISDGLSEELKEKLQNEFPELWRIIEKELSSKI